MRKNIFGEELGFFENMWKSIYYPIYRFVTDIPWQFRRIKYRITLFSKIIKHYDAPWDVLESIPEFVFALYVEYYKSYRSYVERSIEKEKDRFSQYGCETPAEGKAKEKLMKEIYLWITEGRFKEQKDIDNAYEDHHNAFPREWKWKSIGKLDNDGEELLEMVDDRKEKEQNDSRKAFKKIMKLEKDLNEKEDKILKQIIEIKGRLWW